QIPGGVVGLARLVVEAVAAVEAARTMPVQRSVALVQVVVRVVLVVTAAAPGRRDLVGVVDAVLAHGLLLVCGQFRAVWRAYQRCWPARRVARPSALLLDVLGAPALAHRDA